MQARTRFLLVALALLAVAGSGVARADDPGDLEARWAKLRKGTIERLHELATWCKGAKLFGSRAEVYEQILDVDPDDATARRWLRYKRGPDGAWARDAKYKPPRNLREGTDAYQERRSQVGAWYAEEAGPLVADVGAQGLDALRYRVAALGLAVDPVNAAFRGWNGERSSDSSWILVETERALERRPLLRKTGKEAVAAAPAPTSGERTPDDGLGGARWLHVIQGERVRVVGDSAEEELEQVLRNAEATWPVYRKAFGVEPSAFDGGGRDAKGPTVYVATSQDAGNRYLRAQPGSDERLMKSVKGLVALWLRTRPAILLKSPLAVVRLEGAPRQLVQGMLYRHVGLGADRAWALEGLSLYLTWQVTGTRYLASVADVETRYAEKPPDPSGHEDEMSDKETDWLALARDVAAGPNKPDLFLLVGKNVNQLTAADVLYAYGIVAYVLEGHADAAPDFFRAIAGKAGNDLDRVCTDVLGFDAPVLEQRVRRWLHETTEPAAD